MVAAASDLQTRISPLTVTSKMDPVNDLAAGKDTIDVLAGKEIVMKYPEVFFSKDRGGIRFPDPAVNNSNKPTSIPGGKSSNGP